MKPLIGITCNYNEDNGIGRLTCLGMEGQDWNFLAGDYVYSIERAGGIPVLIPQCSSEEQISSLLDRLDGVPKEKRTARFVCAIAAVLPDGRELVTRQTMEGYIGWEPEGENGFGYDPIFYLDEYGCSSAAISPEQKNAISHRGKALRAMKELLKKAEFLGLIDEIEKNI
jgi:non-canonical purine NTP pyrophosphatase (RdgB/HAM1 family)